MKVAIIGTNGFLSDRTGLYCHGSRHTVSWYGLERSRLFGDDAFAFVDLAGGELDYATLLDYDLIVYTSGAGIQSNLRESNSLVYTLNTFVPITLCDRLSSLNYAGALVTFGSCFEIGKNAQDRTFDEIALGSSQFDVPNAYCVSKRLLTRYVQSATQTFRHLHVILPTIYGPGEAPHRLIPYTVNALKAGTPIQFTSGTQVRQYLYVGDVPPVIFDLVRAGVRSGIYNISGNETHTVREIVEKVFAYYGRTPSADLFGTAERADIGMADLQLDDTKLRGVLSRIEYTPLDRVLKQYESCH